LAAGFSQHPPSALAAGLSQHAPPVVSQHGAPGKQHSAPALQHDFVSQHPLAGLQQSSAFGAGCPQQAAPAVQHADPGKQQSSLVEAVFAVAKYTPTPLTATAASSPATSFAIMVSLRFG
jgi:hypothetical protein